jgi:hypothetical protein
MLKFWTTVAKIGIPIAVGVTTILIAWLGYFEKMAVKRHQEDIAKQQELINEVKGLRSDRENDHDTLIVHGWRIQALDHNVTVLELRK